MKILHFAFLAGSALLCLAAGCRHPDVPTQEEVRVEKAAWTAPDTATIPKDEAGLLIRYGRDLIAHTGRYFGPNGSISKEANGMNCQNCHLDAGTKLYANSFCAVCANYPKFRSRSGTVEDLEKRVNDCMERSMNGRGLASASREMQAMIAYINWVGKDVQKGIVPEGTSIVELPWLDRAADPAGGAIAFRKRCVYCHMESGEGQINPDGKTYLFPPLWGPNSYNTAAGMYRLSRLAGYIKSNMPFDKSTYQHPLLTDEEAWDIAAYINSKPRPEKRFAGDWPDVTKKPVDHPFGPYADTFPETQHKYGPFKPILAASKKP